MKTGLLLGLVLLAGASAFGAEGSSGRGGGNSIVGHPVEYYAKDITAFAAYKAKVQPFLNLVSAKIPQLGADLTKVATDKIWYFIPETVPKLSSDITGIPVANDQDIFQTSGAVWIDNTKFSRLSIEDQATFIRHELVMGMYMADSSNEYASTIDALDPGSSVNYDTVRNLTVKLPSEIAQDDPTTLVEKIHALDDFLTFQPALNAQNAPALSLSDAFTSRLSPYSGESINQYQDYQCRFSFSRDSSSGKVIAEFTKTGNGGTGPAYLKMTFTKAPQRSQVSETEVSYTLAEEKPVQPGQIRGYVIIDDQTFMAGACSNACFVKEGHELDFGMEICDPAITNSGSVCGWRKMENYEAIQKNVIPNLHYVGVADDLI